MPSGVYKRTKDILETMSKVMMGNSRAYKGGFDEKGYAEQYHQDNKKKILKRNKQWRKDNPEKCKGYSKQYYKDHWQDHKKHKYNISHKDWSEMWERQDGKCLICEKDFTKPSNAHVDHNHKTDKVRGLLCKKCNAGIGFFNDNIEVMMRAIKYLNIKKGE